MSDQTNPIEAINMASVMVEQERAIAETRAQIQLAKMFPRSMAKVNADFIEACKSRSFAEKAFYSVPNRGSGPSIRFAEELARCFGNFEYGHVELSRSDGRSVVRVFAWDKENNNRASRDITVNHVRDTRQGSYPLTSQADIDGLVANVAAKNMRGRILALVPKAILASGIEECQKTLAGKNEESIAARVAKMVSVFSGYGVKTDQISEYIGHSVDDANIEDLTNLMGVFNAIREGARVSDYFKPKANEEAQESAPPTGLINAVASANGDDLDWNETE